MGHLGADCAGGQSCPPLSLEWTGGDARLSINMMANCEALIGLAAWFGMRSELVGIGKGRASSWLAGIVISVAELGLAAFLAI